MEYCKPLFYTARRVLAIVRTHYKIKNYGITKLLCNEILNVNVRV